MDGARGTPSDEGQDARRPLADSGPSTGRAALAGALAAAVALATGELVAALGGPEQSLVVAVGDRFVDRFAGSLKDLAVRLFGTNDKVALVVGIVVVSLAVGAALGIAARRRPGIAVAGFVAFGVLGTVAAWSDPQAGRGIALAASVAATCAGVATLTVLLRVARGLRPVPVATTATATRTTTMDTPTTPHADRRAFFGWAGAAGAFAAVAATGSRALAERSGVEAARSAVRLPEAAPGTAPAARRPGTTVRTGAGPFDIEGLSPAVVPNDDFYRIDTALVVPQVDPADWRLSVTGMVDRPFELSFDELLALPMVTEAVTLSCVSNEVGGELVGNAVWQGVPLRSLLERAGVQAGATQVFTTSVDGWTCGFPTEAALDGRTALVAVGMNGEPLPVIHGFPARLVVAGLYGYVSATKWVTEIRLTGWDDADGYWIPRGWSKEGPVKTQSRIDVPRRGARLAPGPTPIAGVAWAPGRGIRAVEVQVDGGPWQPATLGDATSDETWVQWVLTWDATPGEHRIRVRATDGSGGTQPEQRRPVAPDGATGWHTREVEVADA